jgi:UDP:flavonoid glycosyltransferase YjiC (YdhE family)
VWRGELQVREVRLVASLDKLTVNHLSTLITEIVNNSTYRDNARKLQKAFTEANGLSVAAQLIEQSLGVVKTASGQLLVGQ